MILVDQTDMRIGKILYWPRSVVGLDEEDALAGSATAPPTCRATHPRPISPSSSHLHAPAGRSLGGFLASRFPGP